MNATGNEIKVFWDQGACRGRGMWAATVNGKRVRCPDMPDDPDRGDFEDAIASLAYSHDIPTPACGWAGTVAVDGLWGQYSTLVA